MRAAVAGAGGQRTDGSSISRWKSWPEEPEPLSDAASISAISWSKKNSSSPKAGLRSSIQIAVSSYCAKKTRFCQFGLRDCGSKAV